MSANPAKEPPLAAAVRRLRHEKGVTQEALAFDANVTIATLSRIERGVTSPAWHTLKQIAGALEITPVELVAAAEKEEAQDTEAEQQGEPDDLLAQGARGVREREKRAASRGTAGTRSVCPASCGGPRHPDHRGAGAAHQPRQGRGAEHG